jgi:MarR family transcriptional regulator, temperature-dependent positive regulator of motility
MFAKRTSSGTTRTESAIGPKIRRRYRRIPGYLARRFHQLCLAIVTESLADDGLSQLQFAAMTVLDDMPGIDLRRLAEALGIAPFNAGQLASELTTMGLVDRQTNGADRRARELRLTSRGQALYQRLQPGNVAANRRILAALSLDEKDTLMELLVRVIESNESYAQPGAGRRKRVQPHATADKSRPSPPRKV